jgi:hypothetical protein
MVELFGIYALLLVGWGLWHQRRAGAAGGERPAASAAAPAAPIVPVAPVVVTPLSERGSAARRHLSTLS